MSDLKTQSSSLALPREVHLCLAGYRLNRSGRQLLLEHEGDDSLSIHEVVAASKFEKGYGRMNVAVDKGLLGCNQW